MQTYKVLLLYVFATAIPILITVMMVPIIKQKAYRIGYQAGCRVAVTAHKSAKDLQIISIEQALRVAYNLSMPEQEVYARVFSRLEEKYQVSWALIAAVVRVESNFTEGLKSKSKAKGLMQLLDSTAAYLANKQKLPYEKDITIWKFAENLYFGTQYLAEAQGKDTTTASIIKYYVAGPNWKQREDRADVRYYETRVLREYERLNYIYKGVSTTDDEKANSVSLQ